MNSVARVFEKWVTRFVVADDDQVVAAESGFHNDQSQGAGLVWDDVRLRFFRAWLLIVGAATEKARAQKTGREVK